MGGNGGFNKWARPLVRPLEDQVQGRLWVDVSVMLYKWNRTHSHLAAHLFQLDPVDPNLRRILTSLSRYLSDQIGLFKTGMADITLVFEGKTDKPRHIKRLTKRAQVLNQGVRDSYLSSSTRAKKRGRRQISLWMGRPPQWLNHLLAQHLRGQGWHVVHCADHFQADAFIIRSARQGDAVLSVDRDFIAFARPNTLSRIVFKDSIKKVPCELVVADILEKAGVSQPRLTMAYIISGCDDATITIKNFGWKRALKFVEQAPDNGQDPTLRSSWQDLGRRFPNHDIHSLEEDARHLSTDNGKPFSLNASST
jgi:hypothetical protein